MGPFGRSVASHFYGLAGVCGYPLIVLGAIAAVRMLLDREPIVPVMIGLGTMLGVVALAMLVHLMAPAIASRATARAARSASTSRKFRAR